MVVGRKIDGLPNCVVGDQMSMHVTSSSSVDHLEDDAQRPWIRTTNNHFSSKLQYLWKGTPLSGGVDNPIVHNCSADRFDCHERVLVTTADNERDGLALHYQ